MNVEEICREAGKHIDEVRKLAEDGDPKAQNCLGACYQRGNGVNRDLDEAFKWFKKAAEQDYAPAQHALGICYFAGDGCAADENEAFKWLKKAANKGDNEAQGDLGFLYVTKNDYSNGLHWLQKGAEGGYANAQYMLGSLYIEGKGVKKDNVKVEYWLNKAAAQGHPEAINIKNLLKNKKSANKGCLISIITLFGMIPFN